MSQDYRFEIDPEWGLSDDDVVNIDGRTMVKLGDLLDALSHWSTTVEGGYHTSWKDWFTEDGAEVEILRVEGDGWQKVRFRFQLEFIPDDPDKF